MKAPPRDTKVDAIQERWYRTLNEIVELPLQTPEVQREIDLSRVDAIVEYTLPTTK